MEKTLRRCFLCVGEGAGGGRNERKGTRKMRGKPKIGGSYKGEGSKPKPAMRPVDRIFVKRTVGNPVENPERH